MDAFRAAALEYDGRLQTVVPLAPAPLSRLGIAVIGQGVHDNTYPLFRKLRPHGIYFSQVKPENGLKLLLQAVLRRAREYPAPYGHWYIDGGEASEHDPALTCVSYHALQPMRSAVLRKMETEIQRGSMGPEELRSILAKMSPRDYGMGEKEDAVLDRFQLSLLTEGSGAQIFSTSFVQWAAREALRRAQPLSLLLRFAPRQRQKSMNELLSTANDHPELDPQGSLVDADMGGYYHWLNQHGSRGGTIFISGVVRRSWRSVTHFPFNASGNRVLQAC